MTAAKQVLEEMGNCESHVHVVKDSPFYKTICSALRVLDAVESGRLVKGLPDSYPPTVRSGEISGFNDCLKELKRIGDGE